MTVLEYIGRIYTSQKGVTRSLLLKIEAVCLELTNNNLSVKAKESKISARIPIDKKWNEHVIKA